MMHLVFVDRYGCEGKITDDGIVEYHGPFKERIETLTTDLDRDEDVTADKLRDLSIDIFAECDLREIKTMGTRYHQED